MDTSDDATAATSSSRSKVARVLTEYELQDLGDEMERRWTDEEDRWSLRDLEMFFNTAILAAALERAGVQPLDGEVENTYRLLTDPDTGSAEKMRARRRLEREGVDVDGVMDDCVSYQAIRTYLKEHRDAEYSPPEIDPLERQKSNTQQLRGRVNSVTEGNIEQLRDSGHLTLGDFRVLVDIRVLCEECNTQYDVDTLLETGGCACAD